MEIYIKQTYLQGAQKETDMFTIKITPTFSKTWNTLPVCILYGQEVNMKNYSLYNYMRGKLLNIKLNTTVNKCLLKHLHMQYIKRNCEHLIHSQKKSWEALHINWNNFKGNTYVKTHICNEKHISYIVFK